MRERNEFESRIARIRRQENEAGRIKQLEEERLNKAQEQKRLRMQRLVEEKRQRDSKFIGTPLEEVLTPRDVKLSLEFLHLMARYDYPGSETLSYHRLYTPPRYAYHWWQTDVPAKRIPGVPAARAYSIGAIDHTLVYLCEDESLRAAENVDSEAVSIPKYDDGRLKTVQIGRWHQYSVLDYELQKMDGRIEQYHTSHERFVSENLNDKLTYIALNNIPRQEA